MLLLLLLLLLLFQHNNPSPVVAVVAVPVVVVISVGGVDAVLTYKPTTVICVMVCVYFGADLAAVARYLCNRPTRNDQ